MATCGHMTEPCTSTLGSCQVKNNPKSRENSEVGYLCFFCLYLFQKKLDRGGAGWVGSGQSNFFSDFSFFFNLTRPLMCREVGQIPTAIMGL